MPPFLLHCAQVPERSRLGFAKAAGVVSRKLGQWTDARWLGSGNISLASGEEYKKYSIHKDGLQSDVGRCALIDST
jgi:hypothetical protein